jgi:hypothetical protein
MTADARADFARRFAALLQDSGLQAKEVVSRVKGSRPPAARWSVTAGLMSSWKTGRNLPSTSNQDGFVRAVRVMTERARGRAARGYPGGELLSEVAWEHLLKQARDEGGADHAKGGVRRQLAALTDPLELEVHRPVQLEDQPADPPVPPAYAQRDRLAELGAVRTLSPSVPSAGASVSIAGPDGRASLGRDVVASGDVGAKRYACYAVGWYVVTAASWTGYFIKAKVNPRVDGSFTTPVLQMGSPGETGSSWQPFLLGATPAGCAWIERLWARTPTGEYHDAWPPPGITVLYHAPAAIHRSA